MSTFCFFLIVLILNTHVFARICLFVDISSCLSSPNNNKHFVFSVGINNIMY